MRKEKEEKKKTGGGDATKEAPSGPDGGSDSADTVKSSMVGARQEYRLNGMKRA